MSFLLRDRSVRIGLVSPEANIEPTQDPLVKGFMGNITRAVELQTITSMFDVDSKKLLKLVGVKEIKFNFVSDIAVENGLAVSFIQPWYIKPAEMTIVGNAYIGAYPFVQRRDADVEVLYNMYLESLNEFGSRTMAGNKRVFQLQIANNPRNADFYYGYIKSFEFNENVERPYLLEYTLQFVGKPKMNSVITDAKRLAGEEKANNEKALHIPSPLLPTEKAVGKN